MAKCNENYHQRGIDSILRQRVHSRMGMNESVDEFFMTCRSVGL